MLLRSLVEGRCHGSDSGRETGSPTVPVDDDSTEPSALSGLWLLLESQHGNLSVTSSLLQLRLVCLRRTNPTKPACPEVVLLI